MSSHDADTSRLGWARRSGTETARLAWAAGLSMDRMVDRVNESMTNPEEDVADAAMDAALEWWENAVDAAEQARDQALEGIALRILDVEGLASAEDEPTNVIEVTTDDMAMALRAAYEAGRKAGLAEVK